MAFSFLWGKIRRGLRLSPSTESLMPLLEAEETDPIEGPNARPFENINLSDEDMERIKSQYVSLRTDVYVTRCVAQLYFKHPHLTPKRWIYQASGVPVVVWLTVESHALLFIVDSQSGAPLWRTVIDNVTNYTLKSLKFHTFTTPRLKAGLRFEEWEPANCVYRNVKKMVERHNNRNKGSWAALLGLRQGDRTQDLGELPDAIKNDPRLPCGPCAACTASTASTDRADTNRDTNDTNRGYLAMRPFHQGFPL